MSEPSEFVSITFHDPLREAYPFAQAWAEAPADYKRLVEMKVAEFFYRVGVRDGEAKATASHNEDLKELARVARERVVR